MRNVLVIGGNGLIGQALKNLPGAKVRSTSRRSSSDFILDLSNITQSTDVWPEADVVVITAAVTSRANCEAYPTVSHHINVVAPQYIAAPVLARGGHVIFLSTHVVLGGDQAKLPIDSPYLPVDTYSRQKSDAEVALRSLPGSSDGLTILRLTKTLDANHGLIAQWVRDAASKKPIVAFNDLLLAPITVENVTEQIRETIEGRAAGIQHLSGWPECTYADLASMLAKQLGWPEVRAIEGRALNAHAALSPRHASLATPCPGPTPGEVVDLLIRQINTAQ